MGIRVDLDIRFASQQGINSVGSAPTIRAAWSWESFWERSQSGGFDAWRQPSAYPVQHAL
jgi:hypothetical protein